MGAIGKLNKWLDGVLSTDIGQPETKTSMPSAPTLSSLLRSWGPGTDDSDLNYPFRQSAVIHACVSLLASKLSALPMMMYRGFDDRKEVTRDPLLSKLMDRPSPAFKTPTELWQLTVCGLLLPPGEVMWYMMGRRDKSGMPDAIQVISGNMFEPLRDQKTGWIIGWKWKGNNVGKQDFTYDEIIQFRLPNPYNPDRGLSPIEAAMYDAKIDWRAAQFNHAFFESGTQIGGTIEPAPGTVVTPEQADGLRRQFSDRHQGARKSHGVVLLPGGATYKPADVTHQEMQFLESRRFNADQIIAVYPGVTRQALGWTEDYNKANSEQAEKDLHVNGVRPLANLIAWTLWSEWLQYRREQTWIQFEDKDLECLQKDKGAQVSSFTSLIAAGISKRNAASFMGMSLDLEKDPYADETYLAGSLVPERLIEQKIAMGALGEAAVGARMLGEVRNLRDALAGPKAEDTSKAITAVTKALSVPKSMFDAKKFAGALKGKLDPLMKDAAEAGVKGIEDETGLSLGYDLLSSEKWGDFMSHKWLKVKTIPKHWNAYLQSVVAGDIKEGKTISQIALDLENRFQQGHPYWSMRIARTEVMDTLDASRYQSMEALEVPYQGWSTAKDEAVRESHAELEGEVVKVGEKFGNGLKYPHDPDGEAGEIIQCFVPDTVVSGAFCAGSKAKYSGPIRRLITRRGNRLSVTPNHPILTLAGWIPAHQLRKGDTLVSYVGDVNRLGMLRNPDNQNGPTRIEDVFNTLAVNGTGRSRMACALDFHGDANAFNGDVEIVILKRKLSDGQESSIMENGDNISFITADSGKFERHGFCHFDSSRKRHLSPRSGGPRSLALTLDESTIALDERPLDYLCFGLGAQLNVLRPEMQIDDGSPGLIVLDELVDFTDLEFTGHVYDLQSKTGYIIAENIVSSNCRCSCYPVYKREEGKRDVSMAVDVWQKSIGRHELRLIKQGIKALAPWWDSMLKAAVKSLKEAN